MKPVFNQIYDAKMGSNTSLSFVMIQDHRNIYTDEIITTTKNHNRLFDIIYEYHHFTMYDLYNCDGF